MTDGLLGAAHKVGQLGLGAWCMTIGEEGEDDLDKSLEHGMRVALELDRPLTDWQFNTPLSLPWLSVWAGHVFDADDVARCAEYGCGAASGAARAVEIP